MRKLLTSLLVALLLSALCVHQPVAQQTGAKETAQPREISDAEIKAADELRVTLSAEQQALYNGLRYLMRPAFEDELLQGRRYRPCTLDPFEQKGAGPLSLLETLRLWAVLQSGMPSSAAMDRQLQRLLDTPEPRAETGLALVAVRMLTVRAALQRPELGRADELKEQAAALLSVADACKGDTSDRSPLIGESSIQVRWFANHLWRALVMRSALELELKVDDKQWEKDLRALGAAYVNNRGWPCAKRGASAGEDLDPNLLALAALGLAQGAPEKTIGAGLARANEKKLKDAPEILARLENDYGAEPWVGSRLLLVNSLAPGFAPERKSADSWRAEVTRRGVANLDPSGAVWMRQELAPAMGLSEPGWGRTESAVCETALTCLALSGGLLPAAPGPLNGRELAGIGRMLHALAVLHAARAGKGGGDFAARVNFAIQDGAAYLASLQTPEGDFPGQYKTFTGNTAYCLLAMMHGGVSREEDSIQRGIAWLLKNADNTGSTYDVAAKLMCLQQYYEPEQRQAGILYADNAADFERARRKVWESISDKHRSYIESLVRFLNESHVGGSNGGWGYYTTMRSHSDNSCSQYAVLGYKSASLLGAQLDTRLLELEAERLIKQYWADENCAPVVYEHNADDREGDDAERKSRSTRAVFRKEIRPGGWGYMCGQVGGACMQLTAAGISSLTICMDELKVRGKLKEKLAQEIGLTIRGAQAWLAGKYYKAEQFTGPADVMAYGGDGWGVFYNLYSVERACVMAGIRKLEGETDWYAIGAEALLEHQNLDGGWGDEKTAQPAINSDRRQLVNTSMAILFLKRAAPPVITEHKKREKEAEEEQKKEEPKSPVTGK